MCCAAALRHLHRRSALGLALATLLWAHARADTPWPGPPEALGGYASGCLIGAVALPEAGNGFRTIRRARNRYFGHPAAQAFLERYGTQVINAGYAPVFVGDIAQARGGRMPSGHRSHQMGLDVDIWFSRPAEVGATDASFPSLVDERRERIEPKVFNDEHVGLLKFAAEDPAVARVFVNWVIKDALCTRIKGPPESRAWLGKIRPWFGHTRHFHVRLRCPDDSPECVDQPAVPEQSDCGGEDWFSRAEVRARRVAKDTRPASPSTAAARPPRPARCDLVTRIRKPTPKVLARTRRPEPAPSEAVAAEAAPAEEAASGGQ